MRRTYLPTLRQKIVLFTLTRPNHSIFEQYNITLIFPVHYSIFLFLTLDNPTWRPLDSHKRCYSIPSRITTVLKIRSRGKPYQSHLYQPRGPTILQSERQDGRFGCYILFQRYYAVQVRKPYVNIVEGILKFRPPCLAL